MKLLFENWRKYTLLTEEQLIIEGRIDDTKTKYPQIAKKREEFDGESLLDVLVDADPTDNQKYLMKAASLLQTAIDYQEDQLKHKPWWGKNTAYMPESEHYAPWGITRRIAEFLPRYHEALPFIRDQDAPFKDFNLINDVSALEAVVINAEQKKQRQEQEKEEKAVAGAKAREESTLVANTPWHIVTRPLTEHSACYFGKGSTWCVAATESENYFDDYTNQGYGFDFVMAKRKNIDPDYKLMTFVINNDGTLKDDEPHKDRVNETLEVDDFSRALAQGMLGQEAWDEIVSFEEGEPFKEEVILEALKNFKGWPEGGVEWDYKPSDVVSLIEAFKEGPMKQYYATLYELGKDNISDEPAESTGPRDEDYEEKLAEYDFQHIHVELQYPSETGLDYIYWEASMQIDVEREVGNAVVAANVAQSPGHPRYEPYRFVDEDLSDLSDELNRAVETALNAINLYPDEIEQNNWGDPAEFYIRWSPGAYAYPGGGDLDQFESWLDDMKFDDASVSDGFRTELIEALEEEGVIEDIEKAEAEKAAAAEEERKQSRDYEYWPDPEAKKKQLELPLQENRIRIKIIKKR